jgi:hypothetical protein
MNSPKQFGRGSRTSSVGYEQNAAILSPVARGNATQGATPQATRGKNRVFTEPSGAAVLAAMKAALLEKQYAFVEARIGRR